MSSAKGLGLRNQLVPEIIVHEFRVFRHDSFRAAQRNIRRGRGLLFHLP